MIRLVPAKGNEPCVTILARNKEAVTSTPASSYLSPLYQDLCTFAYHTGWRRSEGLGLTWARVDTDSGTVRLADPKNGSGPMVALNEQLPLCPLVVRVAAIVPRDPWTVKKWARLTAPSAGLRVVPR